MTKSSDLRDPGRARCTASCEKSTGSWKWQQQPGLLSPEHQGQGHAQRCDCGAEAYCDQCQQRRVLDRDATPVRTPPQPALPEKPAYSHAWLSVRGRLRLPAMSTKRDEPRREAGLVGA